MAEIKPTTCTFEDLIIAGRAAAYEGELNEGSRLIGRLPNSERGVEISRAFEAKIPVRAFREMLDAAWTLDHREVFRAAGHDDKILKRWFKYAAFDVSHIDEHVTLYRGGTCFGSPEDRFWQVPGSLGWGHSWTLDRDAACFFAIAYSRRVHRPRGYPCVVAIRVPRRYALAHFKDRNENEIVAFTRTLNRHIIDGENGSALKAGFDWRPSDELRSSWLAAGERYLLSRPASNASGGQ